MKQFKTSTENLIKILRPDLTRFEQTIVPYYDYSQEEFNSFLEDQNIDVDGTVTDQEEKAISNIISHNFGDHIQCGEWCKHKDEQESKPHLSGDDLKKD